MYHSIINMCYLMWQNLNISGKGIADYTYIVSWLAQLSAVNMNLS